MEQKTLRINRKTGKYEGKGAVPFRNQAAVEARELSEAMAEGPDGLPFRRFTVKFVSGHRYIADIEKDYLTQCGIDWDDTQAVQQWFDSKLSNAEVFRRAIRDFSKQIPLVYEHWFVNGAGQLSVVGHVVKPKAESAFDKRLLPQQLL